MNPKLESDLQGLLARGMGQELHWFPEDVPVSRLAAALVGMANSLGGTILLGVAPRSGELIGLRDVESSVDRLFQAALLVDPALVLPIPQHLTVRLPNRTSPCDILSVTIPGGLPHVYSLDGRYLGREGSQTNPLSARALRALLVERGAIQFESRISQDATLADLDPLQVEAYREKVVASGFIPASLGWEELLLRRGCLKRVDGVLQPTYAGLLLFARVPQQWLPNATVLAGRFPGLALSDVYIKQDIAGTLPDQLRQADAFVSSNLKSVVRMVGLAHQEAPEYPLEAVRELLVNAISHRDYNLQGDNIHLFIFADRLEIQSPGGLPGPVNLSNLLDARFARNAVITRTRNLSSSIGDGACDSPHRRKSCSNLSRLPVMTDIPAIGPPAVCGPGGSANTSWRSNSLRSAQPLLDPTLGCRSIRSRPAIRATVPLAPLRSPAATRRPTQPAPARTRHRAARAARRGIQLANVPRVPGTSGRCSWPHDITTSRIWTARQTPTDAARLAGTPPESNRPRPRRPGPSGTSTPERVPHVAGLTRPEPRSAGQQPRWAVRPDRRCHPR